MVTHSLVEDRHQPQTDRRKDLFIAHNCSWIVCAGCTEANNTLVGTNMK